MNFDTDPQRDEPPHDPFRNQLAYLTFVVATILLACAPALVVWFWHWAV